MLTLTCHRLTRRVLGPAPRLARRIAPVAAAAAVSRPRPAAQEWACHLTGSAMPDVPTLPGPVAPSWFGTGSLLDRPGVLALTTQSGAPMGADQPVPVPIPGPLGLLAVPLIVLWFLFTFKHEERGL